MITIPMYLGLLGIASLITLVIVIWLQNHNLKGENSMNRMPVTSSVLKWVGYNAESLTLEIEFQDKSLYQYFNVPNTAYEGLMNAESRGDYLSSTIRESSYRYVCVKEANPKLGMKILPGMKGLPNR